MQQSAGREGGRAGPRRPVHFWRGFNDWWRKELERCGNRPSSSQIAKWYEEHAEATWGADIGKHPSLSDTKIHAKCLRSVDAVRKYFRTYRAVKNPPKRSKPSARGPRRSSSDLNKSDGDDLDEDQTTSEDQVTDEAAMQADLPTRPAVESAPLLRHSSSCTQGPSMSLNTGLLLHSSKSLPAPLPPLPPVQSVARAPLQMWPCLPPEYHHQQQQQQVATAHSCDRLPQCSTSRSALQDSPEEHSTLQGGSDGSSLELLDQDPNGHLPAAAAAAAAAQQPCSPMAKLYKLADADEELLLPLDDDDDLSLDLSYLFQEEDENREPAAAGTSTEPVGIMGNIRPCSPPRPADLWEQQVTGPYAPAPHMLGVQTCRYSYSYSSSGVQQRSWSYPGGQVGNYPSTTAGGPGQMDCSGALKAEQEYRGLQILQQQQVDDRAVQQQQQQCQGDQAAYMQQLITAPPQQHLSYLAPPLSMVASRPPPPGTLINWQPASRLASAPGPDAVQPLMWLAAGPAPRQDASAMEPGRESSVQHVPYGHSQQLATYCPHPFV